MIKRDCSVNVQVIIWMVIVVIILGGAVYRVSIGESVATEQQLLNIVRETPCAEEAFRDALTPKEGLTSDPGDIPKPLTVNKAYELASTCKEREKQISAMHEEDKVSNKQLESLSEIRK